MKIIRVFPRKTNATPDDDLVRFDIPTMFDVSDEVHIDCTFTYDLKKAEWLYGQWKHVAPTEIGGVALGTVGGEFEPGKYIKGGYVITSRGCPNKCWFCSVWRRDGNIRELEIKDGWNVLDDNLLACSEGHIRSVFAMLKSQKRRAEFTGGLDSRLLKDWHIDLLVDLRPKQIFLAYDTEDDYEPLVEAGKRLQNAGFGIENRILRCFVLIGYPKDSFEKAEERLKRTLEAGFIPMAMLYRDKEGKTDKKWRRFQREWSRPAIIMSNI